MSEQDENDCYHAVPASTCVRCERDRLQAEVRRLTEQNRLLVEAVDRSQIALNDWIYTYASECCEPSKVAEAIERIRENHGTLAYIAQVLEANQAALAAVKNERPQKRRSASPSIEVRAEV